MCWRGSPYYFALSSPRRLLSLIPGIGIIPFPFFIAATHSPRIARGQDSFCLLFPPAAIQQTY
ncbi:hypothetical protein HMPREF9080_00792 [Cardiobacterium valvarum F0432]|uniref:Uncharacterized protein n=1 Tax=Cardiobacterium valvarum F0432 TaxID=797473 RepID=G9ZDF8_9GAMM|nr:hypothetical protein HMPREF9080_00792 [Cardiobacterium valvarum F0432]